MTAKEYLSQARFLDDRINSKIQQISSLNELATKCTATISDMPHGLNSGGSTMADAVCKIVDLQEEINRDIDSLVDLKRDIVRTIKSVQNPEYQIILELRYLCFKTWEEIAVQMNCSIDNVFKIRKNALKSVVIPES